MEHQLENQHITRFLHWWVVVLILFFSISSQAAGGDSPIFESDIRPILAAKCFECHGRSKLQAKLDLRTFYSILRGGKSGSAIMLGSSEQSLLVEKVSSGAMPLGDEKLSPEEVQLIRLWIDQGALTADREAVGASLTEKDVLPIFQMRCFVCHGKRKQEGGLDLRTLAGRLKGGDSGPALIPGDPDASLLLQRIVSEEMPPPELLFEYRVRPPSAKEVETLRQWIAVGARPDPSRGPDQEAQLSIAEEDAYFWSFLPPQRLAVPVVRQQELVRNPIDAFLLAKLEAKNLSYSSPAGRLVLLRRVFLDLIGMPPTTTEVEDYFNDQEPDAYERMIERLLASSHYGERWAQHWLDVAGYADSEGLKLADLVRHHAWRYRDYVIRSLNNDLPYDQFLSEQLAGDELIDYKKEITPSVIDSLAATGFLRMVPDATNSPANASLAEKMDVIHDEIKVLSSALLGITMGCARCHDHKYDPISQRDYYNLSAILQTAYDPHDWMDPTQRFLDVALESERNEIIRMNAPIKAQIKRLETAMYVKAEPLRQKVLGKRLAPLPQAVQRDLRTLLATPKEKRGAIQKYLARQFKETLEISEVQLAAEDREFEVEVEKTKKLIDGLEKTLRPNPSVRALFDMGGEPSPVYVLKRGEANSIGDRVYPGVPAVISRDLPPFKPVPPKELNAESSGNRLALARWFTHPNHPLTARVMVNRIWMHHFGRGIVATPDNFGRTGSAPSHPQLLDWLAVKFVVSGWSIKAMHRLMMTSTGYRQSSHVSPQNQRDAGNLLWSRMPMRRMDAEVLFDSMLRTTGRLDPKFFGPPREIEELASGEVIAKGSRRGWRRAIYIQKRRSLPVTLFDVFDAPRMAPNCTERRNSNVAPQALQMMNGYMARELARYLAGRLIDAFPNDPEKQVVQLYLGALSRFPTDEEKKMILESLSTLSKEWEVHLQTENDQAPRRMTARWSALGSLCHAVLSSAEFVYID